MLMPDERADAIRILTDQYQGSQMHHQQDAIKKMLMFGHRGFAQYSDLELMRAMQTLAKKNPQFEVQNFVSKIAADRFLME